MAKAAAINMSDAFSPPPQTQVITPPSIYGDFLPSVSNPAGPGPSSAASQRLSGQVRALSASKERLSTGSSYASKRLSGPIASQSPSTTPMTAPSLPSDIAPGIQPNAKLPPLMHGYGAQSPGRMGTGTSTTVSQHGDKQHPHGEKQLMHGEKLLLGEVVQPFIQHPSILPGPTPASYPYQPKRKPPSAFMRNNPMLQQLDTHHRPQQQHAQLRSASAGSARTQYGLLDNSYGASGGVEGDYGGGAAGSVDLPNDAQAQQFAAEVMAAAEAAVAQGKLHQPWGDQNGFSSAADAGGFMSTPPWGVSSVSDLEALDSILDQLVVVDARMRKALLKGPLISFETVVPEHIMNPFAAPAQQQQDEEKERTFLTAVKGVVEEEGIAEEENSGADHGGVAAMPPPPSPAELEASSLGGAFTAASPSVRQPQRTIEEMTEPRDSAMFPASIPNPGMHPTFTRAYLASKMASKPQHLPPPPPATAEHLLRSRPPPFIAAPSYDQLCSQIRDVQRQYTCGSSRPLEKGATSVGAGPSGVVTAGSITAAIAAGVPIAPTAHQYISGLDGPTLDEMVAHQELPISLERVRPTFVALKHKARRSASPRRRPMSPGRSAGHAGGDGEAVGPQ
ncbi:hypothetical protein Vafri_1545 [Volvox africanus]|nr:hypothetical protein Vafri_1545 [Volvox africanus]